MLLVGALGALIYRYPPLLKLPSTEQPPTWSNFRQALQTPLVLLFGAFLLVYVGIEASFSNWAYSVQVLARSRPPLVAGYSVSAYWMGLTLGRFMLGYFLRSLGAIRTISLSLVLLMIGLLAWWQLPDQWLSLPLIGFVLAAIFPAIIWLMPKRLPAALVPAAIGFATSAASVGTALMPTGIGWLANGFGLRMIPLFMLPLAIVMGGLHLGLRHYSEAPFKSSAN